MEATKSREIIFKNMDAMSLEMDTLQNLIEVRKGLSVYISKIEKSINKGREANKNLESYCKREAA